MSTDDLSTITLEQYAGIIVALDEGHALGAVLAQEAVPEESWASIDTDFKDRITADREIFSAYAGFVAEAEDHLARPLPPLDEDAAAYLCVMSLLASGDSTDWLARHALTLADVSRLRRHWERRFADDVSLRESAFSQAETLAPPEDIQPGAPVLRPFRWSPGTEVDEAQPDEAAAEDARSLKRPADPLMQTLDPALLPSAFGPRTASPAVKPSPTSPKAAPPPPAAQVSTPSPRPKPAEGLKQTVPHEGRPGGPALPFRGEGQAPRAAPGPRRPHPSLGETAPIADDGAGEPSTPFRRPSRSAAVEPPPAAQPTPAKPKKRRRRGPAAFLRQTVPVGEDLPFGGLPFAGEGKAPGRVVLEPHPALGRTAVMPGEDAQPPGNADADAGANPREKRRRPAASLRETAPVGDVVPSGELPFSGERPPPPREKRRPHPSLGQTAAMPGEGRGGTPPPASDEPPAGESAAEEDGE